MNLDLSFWFAVFLRRIHYFILTFVLVTAAALAAAFLLPPVYTASSTLLVESSSIPGPLSAPTVQAQALEKLQTIEKRLMTRANLLEIAKKLRAFKDIDKMTPDEIVQAMRDNTRIGKSAGRGQATIMTISFDAERPGVAAGVVNEYVTLILQADVELRTRNAEDTVEFFRQQVEKLSGELDIMKARILDFQNANADALPNTLNFRMNQQQLLQSRLSVVERDIATLKDQRERMLAIFESTGQVTGSTIAQTPEARQLDQARQQLTTLLSTLSPQHPRVRQLQAQIASLEEIVRAQLPTTGAGGQPGGTAASMLDIQLADLDTRIQLLEEERVRIIDDLDKLKLSIDKTPANQIALDALTRDYNNIQQQYNIAVDKLAKAEAGEEIEVRSKGERVVVVEPASEPTRPTKPNRILIAGMGGVAGVVLGVAMVVLRELLNRAVRRPTDLVRAFGITPIVTIPYMRTPREARMRRAGFVVLLMLVAVGIPAMIYAVHVYYQPLDLILQRAAARFGIRL